MAARSLRCRARERSTGNVAARGRHWLAIADCQSICDCVATKGLSAFSMPPISWNRRFLQVCAHAFKNRRRATGTMTAMNLVKHILEDARRRLAVLGRDASICDAAAHLTDANTPLVIVCDGDGLAVGVLSSTDIVKVLARQRIRAARPPAVCRSAMLPALYPNCGCWECHRVADWKCRARSRTARSPPCGPTI